MQIDSNLNVVYYKFSLFLLTPLRAGL